MSEFHTINEVFLFVHTESTGEGVIAQHLPGQGWMPLVCADAARLKNHLLLANSITVLPGETLDYRILRFTNREDVTELIRTKGPEAAAGNAPPPIPGPSQYDLDNMDSIIGGRGDWFSARLMRLIKSADLENRERMRIAYPKHVEAVMRWEHQPLSASSKGKEL